MNTQTVRITKSDHAVLARLARQSGKTMTTLLGDAIEALQRETLLQRTNEGYVALKNNREQWEEEMQDRQCWDVTLSDGLE